MAGKAAPFITLCRREESLGNTSLDFEHGLFSLPVDKRGDPLWAWPICGVSGSDPLWASPISPSERGRTRRNFRSLFGSARVANSQIGLPLSEGEMGEAQRGSEPETPQMGQAQRGSPLLSTGRLKSRRPNLKVYSRLRRDLFGYTLSAQPSPKKRVGIACEGRKLRLFNPQIHPASLDATATRIARWLLTLGRPASTLTLRALCSRRR